MAANNDRESRPTLDYRGPPMRPTEACDERRRSRERLGGTDIQAQRDRRADGSMAS